MPAKSTQNAYLLAQTDASLRCNCYLWNSASRPEWGGGTEYRVHCKRKSLDRTKPGCTERAQSQQRELSPRILNQITLDSGTHF